MINQEIRTLFPTPILFSSLGRDITDAELNVIENNYKPEMDDKNDGNFTSKNRYILNDNLPELRKEIQSQIDYYLKTVIDPSNDISLYITQSWLNYTEQNHFHHEHFHQNSIISGVFYFNAIKEHDKIWFFKNQFRDLRIIQTPNYYNAESWWYEVETGVLVLFPSHLVHSVPVTTGSHTRISLAFNTFATGIFGKEEDLNSLHLSK
jgi:uncharacterized protein (TIGR02466 family)